MSDDDDVGDDEDDDDDDDNGDLKQGRRRWLREHCLKILFPVTVIICDYSQSPCMESGSPHSTNKIDENGMGI